MQQAIELLNQAVARDPAFFEAYYQLVFAHGYAYSALGDHTPARLALAEAALQAATRLRPDAGETHLARANYLYRCLRDYNGALAELEVARRSLPNDPRIFELTGYILRRRGQQEEGARNLERSVELDPRNFYTLQQLAISYQYLRRYPEEAAVLDRALTIVPNDVATKTARAALTLTGKPRRGRCTKRSIRFWPRVQAQFLMPPMTWFICALAERDPTAAERALVALGDNPCWSDGAVHFKPQLWRRIAGADDERRGESTRRLYQGSSRTGEDRASAARLWTAALRARSDRRRAGAKRRGVARRAARDRTSSGGKRFNRWQSDACLFRYYRCLGGREGHCFAIPGGQRPITRRIPRLRPTAH